MKMVQAMVRPEKEGEVIAGLEKAGFYSLTRQGVFGRGRQRGIQVGPVRYEELPKVWLMLVVEEQEVDRVVETIKIAARTGNPGDGKIFISTPVKTRSIRRATSDKGDRIKQVEIFNEDYKRTSAAETFP